MNYRIQMYAEVFAEVCCEPEEAFRSAEAFLRFARGSPHPRALWDVICFTNDRVNPSTLYHVISGVRREVRRPLTPAHFRALLCWARRCCRGYPSRQSQVGILTLAKLVGAMVFPEPLRRLREFVVATADFVHLSAVRAMLDEMRRSAGRILETHPHAPVPMDPIPEEFFQEFVVERGHREANRIMREVWSTVFMVEINSRERAVRAFLERGFQSLEEQSASQIAPAA